MRGTDQPCHRGEPSSGSLELGQAAGPLADPSHPAGTRSGFASRAHGHPTEPLLVPSPPEAAARPAEQQEHTSSVPPADKPGLLLAAGDRQTDGLSLRCYSSTGRKSWPIYTSNSHQYKLHEVIKKRGLFRCKPLEQTQTHVLDVRGGIHGVQTFSRQRKFFLPWVSAFQPPSRRAEARCGGHSTPVDRDEGQKPPLKADGVLLGSQPHVLGSRTAGHSLCRAVPSWHGATLAARNKFSHPTDSGGSRLLLSVR